MSTVNRRICGISNNESVLGTSMPDARLEDNKYLNDCVFDFRQKLRALPAFLQDLNATYTRNSEKRVEQDGALVTLAANQFGTSYDPVTGMYGYVPEPAATNLCTYSEQVGGATWENTSVSISANSAVAPDGNTTADSLVESAVTDYHFTRRSSLSVTSGASYTGSVFAKYNGRRYLQVGFGGTAFSGTGRRAIFDLQGGTVTLTESGVSASIVYIGNGWYRLSVTATTTSASAAAFFDLLLSSTASVLDALYLGNGTSGVFVWGAQIETGSRATSYIATTGSTASRAADVLSVPLANIPGFSAAGYTLFADCRMDYVATSGSARAITVSTGFAADRSTVGFSGLSQKVSILTNSGGVSQHAVEFSTWNTSRRKIGYSVAANSYLIATEGVAQTPDTSGIMPVGLTRIDIGSAYGTADYLNGFLFRAGLIPQALTQAQINGLTTL